MRSISSRITFCCLLALLVVGTGLGCLQAEAPAFRIDAAPLGDLKDLDGLKAVFNQQTGTYRLLLLLSPT